MENVENIANLLSLRHSGKKGASKTSVREEQGTVDMSEATSSDSCVKREAEKLARMPLVRKGVGRREKDTLRESVHEKLREDTRFKFRILS